MTLTEQWKKGELPYGNYYVKNIYGNVVNDLYRDNKYDEWMLHSDREICEILAPVPSYEEWQELQEYKRIVTSYNMKPIDYDIACETVNKLLDEKEKLRNELGLLKESIGKDCGTYYTNLFLQENQQLKELLKECKPYISYSINKNKYLGWTPPESNILTKIDNAIGEKK